MHTDNILTLGLLDFIFNENLKVAIPLHLTKRTFSHNR